MMFITIIALIHWEVKVGSTSMKDVGGASFAGSSPPFLGRELGGKTRCPFPSLRKQRGGMNQKDHPLVMLMMM